MALGAFTQWEVRTTAAAADANGGGFNPANTSMATNGAVTSATGDSPVFHSDTYTFVAGDVDAKIFIKSGTNSIPGWYNIASVSGGDATLDAAIGTADLYPTSATTTPGQGLIARNTTAGCGTNATLSTLTWTVDYSQQDAAPAAGTFTDMLVGSTTTQFTSVINPVGKNMIGNIINVLSGATVQRVEVVSTVTITATCDKSLGTAAQVGVGNLGGALLTIHAAPYIAGNRHHVKDGTYTVTATQTWKAGGDTTSGHVSFVGYGTRRMDGGTKPLQTTATNSVTLFSGNAKMQLKFENMSFSHTAGTRGLFFLPTVSFSGPCLFRNCVFDGFTAVVNDTANNFGFAFINCEIKNCTTIALACGADLFVAHNYIHDCVAGIDYASSTYGVSVMLKNIIYNMTSGIGIRVNSGGGMHIIHGNAVKDCSSDGIKIVLNYPAQLYAYGNILVSNGGYGINFGSSVIGSYTVFGNAYHDNVSGQTVKAPTRYDEITLTGDPFTSTTDFSLISTGGGAQCRAAGFPGVLTGGGTGYADIGPLQHQDAGGGGGPVGQQCM